MMGAQSRRSVDGERNPGSVCVCVRTVHGYTLYARKPALLSCAGPVCLYLVRGQLPLILREVVIRSRIQSEPWLVTRFFQVQCTEVYRFGRRASQGTVQALSRACSWSHFHHCILCVGLQAYAHRLWNWAPQRLIHCSCVRLHTAHTTAHK